MLAPYFGHKTSLRPSIQHAQVICIFWSSRNIQLILGFSKNYFRVTKLEMFAFFIAIKGQGHLFLCLFIFTVVGVSECGGR